MSKSSSGKSKGSGSGKKDKDVTKKSASSKKGGDLVSRTIDSIQTDKPNVDDIIKNIGSIKALLTGEPGDESVVANSLQFANDVIGTSFLKVLTKSIALIPPDNRKDIVTIFYKLFKQQNGEQLIVIDYIAESDHGVITGLCDGCKNEVTSMTCNIILVEACRYEQLTKLLLTTQNFVPFFALVQDTNFDIASNSFTTFKELLTKHKTLVASFLETNYDQIFDHYKELLNSTNYVTKRTSLKLLGELLLDRTNFHVMTKYIAQASNLKLMMNLLRDPSKNIQFEAFHVFKVFVANPKKPQAVLDILVKNKNALITYLTDFHNDKSEDDQFMEEKQYLIRQIQSL